MITIRNLRGAVAVLMMAACAKSADTGSSSDTSAGTATIPPALTDSGAMTAPVVRAPDDAVPVLPSNAKQGSGAPRTPAASLPGEPREPAVGGPKGPKPRKGAGDQSQIAALELQARALAKTAGCQNSGQCRTAPVGSRPCGGPRLYLVYCPLTTDSAALFRKLGELERAEQALNMEQGMASTCEMRMPPEVALVGGSCRAVQSSPLGPELRP